MLLAAYASDPARSRGRRFFEPAAPTRTEYQRDRDRIVHSTAFRRLVYKTQVFLNHEGDLFRTRLTHSLEVAQLGRSIARTLRLDEDLVEAIALAHDLGHTPFGHAGQDALNEALKSHDPASIGFEHNMQSLRVVDSLEECYPRYDGLNLTFETREGILKHCSPRNARTLEAREPGGVARRFVAGLAGNASDPATGAKATNSLNTADTANTVNTVAPTSAARSAATDPVRDSLQPTPTPRWQQPGLEAQLANLADEIAYNAHDIDDGVRSGLLSMEQLETVELFSRFRRAAEAAHAGLQGRRLLFETLRRMLSAQVYDVTDATTAALAAAAPDSPDAVCRLPALVRFSSEMAVQSRELKRFLLQNLYRHPQVLQTTQAAQVVVRELFTAYMNDAAQLPISYAPAAASSRRARAVADYIAGMTDRFATREHERLTGRLVFNTSQPLSA